MWFSSFKSRNLFNYEWKIFYKLWGRQRTNIGQAAERAVKCNGISEMLECGCQNHRFKPIQFDRPLIFLLLLFFFFFWIPTKSTAVISYWFADSSSLRSVCLLSVRRLCGIVWKTSLHFPLDCLFYARKTPITIMCDCLPICPSACPPALPHEPSRVPIKYFSGGFPVIKQENHVKVHLFKISSNKQF